MQTSMEMAKDFMDNYYDLSSSTTELLARRFDKAKKEHDTEIEELIWAVAHIGVNFGYGEYVLEQRYIDMAKQIYNENYSLETQG